MGFNPVTGVKNFFTTLRNAPEAQYIVSTAAESQFPSQSSLVVPEKVHYLETTTSVGQESFQSSSSNNNYALAGQQVPLPARPEKEGSGILDKVVAAAGSRWALGFVLVLLVVWGILGGVFGATDTWQVLLQDVSSLQAYFSATLLMRQQNNNTRGLLKRICNLISRSTSNERMVQSLTAEQRRTLQLSQRKIRGEILEGLKTKEDLFDKVANAVANFVGSLLALSIYTAAIILWVFLGIPAGFSDTWQLWVNTGTALEITFVTMFLQNIRSQHEHHMEKTVESIEQLDKEIEMQLRRMTGDMTPNPTIASEPPKLSTWVRGIDIYGFIIGGSIGLTISAVVFATWIAVGDDLEFDDNWWLIIGTYTGLIGFIDGFILKNVDWRETEMAKKHFDQLVAQDAAVFALIGIEVPHIAENTKTSFNQRMSNKIGHWVESTFASYFAIFTVIALLVAASAMQWTETGQLLCNTPTMIAEGFLLITLLNAHNTADVKRRLIYDNVLQRRLVLDKHLAAADDTDSDSDGESVNEKLEESGYYTRTFQVNGVDVEMGPGGI